jgi:preprotein translocase subunit YajC
MGLIRDAHAQQGPMGAPPGVESFFLLIAFFAVFYFLMIRPQLKRQKEHRKLVSEIKPGDEVVTSGGLLGRITAADEQYLTLEVARGVEIRVQRQAVGQVLPKGTFKTS